MTKFNTKGLDKDFKRSLAAAFRIPERFLDGRVSKGRNKFLRHLGPKLDLEQIMTDATADMALVNFSCIASPVPVRGLWATPEEKLTLLLALRKWVRDLDAVERRMVKELLFRPVKRGRW